ncbi:hypothetical protein DFH06DRAFT_554846 [Mycena polygramma]|nr:hypothetical protein DFH06DRAFT_554846 [Mycena polygramma]
MDFVGRLGFRHLVAAIVTGMAVVSALEYKSAREKEAGRREEQPQSEQARFVEADDQAELRQHEQARRVEADRQAEELRQREQARRAEAEHRFTCCICIDTFHAPVVTMCIHIFCEKCFQDLLIQGHACPKCRMPLADECMRDALFEQELASAIANGLIPRRESFLNIG